MDIGFIGIGIMGKPMSRNLISKSGCRVMVYDINKDAVEEQVEAGALQGESPEHVASSCRVIFTMLPRDEHVRAVYRQLLPVSRPGQIFVDMSTISPSVSRELAAQFAERGVFFLDAPVVKSRPAAIEGTLGIYVGGPRTQYEEILPLLRCMGSNIIHLGSSGAGLVMKLCHNMLVGQIQNGVNEMLYLAKKTAGIDVDCFAEAVSYGGAGNFYLESKATAIKNQDFTTAFAAEYMHKDVNLAKTLCEESGVSLKGVELVAERYEETLNMGWGREDFSCTCKLFTHEET